jgi:S-adenosylmethionine decarboxylase
MEYTARARMAALSNAHDGGPEEGHARHVERRTNAPIHVVPGATANGLDYFVKRDGMRFAGTHLIIDLWQASSLDDLQVVKAALHDAATLAGATLLNVDLHCFTPNGGITGVAVLAESHISIHTWPERAYAAVDVFMCGDAEPHKAIEVLRRAFRPRMLTVSEHRRGVMP